MCHLHSGILHAHLLICMVSTCLKACQCQTRAIHYQEHCCFTSAEIARACADQHHHVEGFAGGLYCYLCEVGLKQGFAALNVTGVHIGIGAPPGSRAPTHVLQLTQQGRGLVKGFSVSAYNKHSDLILKPCRWEQIGCSQTVLDRNPDPFS